LLKHANSTKPKEGGSRFDIYLFKVPHAAIREFICGIKTDPGSREKIIAKAKILRVPVWETQLSRISFKLERKKAYSPPK